jgi:hypothetical protein
VIKGEGENMSYPKLARGAAALLHLAASGFAIAGLTLTFGTAGNSYITARIRSTEVNQCD